MKVNLTNGMVYDIPKDVKYANLQIAFTNIELSTKNVNVRKLKREALFKQNNEILRDYTQIGFQNIDGIDDEMQVELHWFIEMCDLNKCSVEINEN